MEYENYITQFALLYNTWRNLSHTFVLISDMSISLIQYEIGNLHDIKFAGKLLYYLLHTPQYSKLSVTVILVLINCICIFAGLEKGRLVVRLKEVQYKNKTIYC